MEPQRQRVTEEEREEYEEEYEYEYDCCVRDRTPTPTLTLAPAWSTRAHRPNHSREFALEQVAPPDQQVQVPAVAPLHRPHRLDRQQVDPIVPVLERGVRHLPRRAEDL